MSYIQLCDKSKHEFLNEDGSLATFQPRIEVIAFALSNINRFTGHVGGYSVAQHSICCAIIIAKQEPDNYKLQLSALLHDATEAYLNDVVSPLKALLPEYKKIEDHYHDIIDKFFNIETRCDKVKQADMMMLAREAEAFKLDMLLHDIERIGIKPCRTKLGVFSPTNERRLSLDSVYSEFMQIYHYLKEVIYEEKT
tara:strand:+ start:9737 stop:10324 length:588 start_codon:yes stop_codon:yes gene_type:complete